MASKRPCLEVRDVRGSRAEAQRTIVCCPRGTYGSCSAPRPHAPLLPHIGCRLSWRWAKQQLVQRSVKPVMW